MERGSSLPICLRGGPYNLISPADPPADQLPHWQVQQKNHPAEPSAHYHPCDRIIETTTKLW